MGVVVVIGIDIPSTFVDTETGPILDYAIVHTIDIRGGTLLQPWQYFC